MDLKSFYKFMILSAIAINFNCTEPFTTITETFEDALVVEATITDELKTQEIKVSRTYLLEEDSSLVFETNAKVVVEGSNNMTYNFAYTDSGVYKSTEVFRAEGGVSYLLNITTVNGGKYSSNSEILPARVEIDTIYAESITINGKKGIQVFVDSETNQQNENYFRYEYDESYKIIAEYFAAFDISLENWREEGTKLFCAGDPDLEFRPLEQKTCYSSNNLSNNILVTNLNGLDEERVSRYPIRFIASNNYIIRDRYSILVKQFVQSADANNFYRILKQLRNDESLLIDNQPGFVRGNISSENNENEKVIGFFDVSSVSSKRIFFDYSDFDFKKPVYPFSCSIGEYNYGATAENPSVDGDERARLFDLLTRGYKYYGQDQCLVFIVPPKCGDCTTFASSEKPIFWED